MEDEVRWREAFHGLKMVSPHLIRIEDITRDQAGDLVVKVARYSPRPGQVTQPAVTSPVHIVKIERTDREIRFEIVELPYRPDIRPVWPK